MKKTIKNWIFVIVLTLMCGGIFPLALTGVAQLTMSHQANGSLMYEDGVIVGSELVGQNFEESTYFWGRPSRVFYNMQGNDFGSGSNNYSVTDSELKERIETRLVALSPEKLVPTDLVTESGSGLDPHISYEAARFQVTRVSAATGLSETDLLELIDTHTDNHKLTHVLALNRALYELQK
ncbi:potassium-transporting ATPase subunit C [Erysipelothrix sp. HDW6B]|uniref:potassium-transporting ATPase subunit C n=1 Tax=Erysipelothrix sp. HDW6B TaxID=2714929 RepID=UPI00140AE768|nr:potassium-transporting ATPase subunit C [Erysipelothrix sp. HDW6B]QIK86892.1 potassium-transporting ATPase subunit C [Erysipelothrix sp. HDW6B]